MRGSSPHTRGRRRRARESSECREELRRERGRLRCVREVQRRVREVRGREHIYGNGSARGGAKNRGRSLRRGRLSRLTVKNRMKQLRLLQATTLILPHPRMKFLHPYTKNPRWSIITTRMILDILIIGPSLPSLHQQIDPTQIASALTRVPVHQRVHRYWTGGSLS